MPLDFPPTPSVNSTYSFGGKTWKWNGAAWEVYFSIDSGAVVTGTSFEVEVTAGATQYIIGLPDDVVVGGGISTNYLNFANGSTFSGNSSAEAVTGRVIRFNETVAPELTPVMTMGAVLL